MMTDQVCGMGWGIYGKHTPHGLPAREIAPVTSHHPSFLLFESNDIWDVGHFQTGNPRLVFPLRLLHGTLQQPKITKCSARGVYGLQINQDEGDETKCSQITNNAPTEQHTFAKNTHN